MLPRQKGFYTKCYLYKVYENEPRRNVTYTKCTKMSLDEMLLYKNALYKMLLIPVQCKHLNTLTTR